MIELERAGALSTPTAYETLIERPDAPSARFSLLESMIVSRGDKSDWELLHDLHYKAESLPIGPRFWKLTLFGETIGVLVTGNPRGLIKERHVAFPKLKPGGDESTFSNTKRYEFINGNFRLIARFVVDTMYRGIGAGYRMMNLVSRMEGNTFMEIQSSMSKFNHFGQKAGFKFVPPMNANKYLLGLKFFRANFEASPQDFEAIVAEIESKPEHQQAALIAECKAFYYRHSSLEKTGNRRGKGKGKVEEMEVRQIIRAIQQLILSSPMYGIWKSPDRGRPVPQELPLTAFDWQRPTEPLRLP